MEFTTTTITDEQDIFGLLATADAIPAWTPAVRMTTRRVAGYCGFCGAVRIIPAHPVTELAPRPQVTCGHTSD